MTYEDTIVDLTYKYAQAKLSRLHGPTVERYYDDIKHDVALKAIQEARKDRWKGKPESELLKYLSFSIGKWVVNAVKKYEAHHENTGSLDDVLYEDNEGFQVTMADTLQGDDNVGSYVDAVIKLDTIEEQIGWRDMEVLRMYHEYGYTAQEILQERPDLDISDVKTIRTIINQNKR